jgi:hypothetical protein
MQPVHIPLTGPFRFPQQISFDPQRSVILDVFHQVALILAAIQEGMAPKKDDRSPYDRILLDQFGSGRTNFPAAD